jgi:hypothetical protein
MSEMSTMKKITSIAGMFALTFAMATQPAMARDTVHNYPVESALKTAEAVSKVDAHIPLYFAGQQHPAEASSLGTVDTRRKTNAFNHSDEDACQHVFLSAVLALQDAARNAGADAVIDIKSNYENVLRESPTEYTCGAGAFIAGVTLTGRLVKFTK